MGSSYKLAKRILQNTRSFHSYGKVPLEAILPPGPPNEANIYRIPSNMRQVESKAYEPSIVSIGPYNHGLSQLQAMENVKRESLQRLFDPRREHGLTLETLFDSINSLEAKIRACYSDSTINLESDEFIETIVKDGCFILELFRESMKQTSTYDSVFSTRWMLPVLRRDLIMLENQIPFFVLSRLFDLTRYSDTPNITSTLVDLAVNFFDPLMPRDKEVLNEGIARTKGQIGVDHLLGLFRSSFLPQAEIIRGKESHMFRSINELRESGVKLKKREGCGTLDICFNSNTGILRIPPMFMDDYSGTLLRNIVAFEQCHPACKPDFTSYLFFMNGLINTYQDVELLHYAGVIQHSLGSDGELANLVNKLCREVAHDVDKSYLHLLSKDMRIFCNGNWNKWRAEWKHEYFGSPWAMISLVSAVVFFILALIQTYCDIVSYLHKFGSKRN